MRQLRMQIIINCCEVDSDVNNFIPDGVIEIKNILRIARLRMQNIIDRNT